MSKFETRLRAGIENAVRVYWRTRSKQDAKQGKATGSRDSGNRAAVTAGKQLDGFIQVVRTLVVECGVRDADVHTVNARLPGFYRPAKDWDLLVLVDKTLLATIEVKSQAGPSFGNNFNNRIEEALGNATDFWAAYQQGAFKPSTRPFLGYLMLLEEDKGSTAPVKERRQSQFPIFPEFVNTSYADRYRLFCRKVLRDRLYDAACLLLSNKASGKKGIYSEPDPELSFQNFALALMARAIAYVKQRDS